MKTKFIAPNGIKVEGIVLYTSPIARDSKSFVNRVYDEIVYAQNRLVKLHHVMELDDIIGIQFQDEATLVGMK